MISRARLEKCSTRFLERLYNSKVIVDIPKIDILEILDKRAKIKGEKTK